jgi:transposase InsO family protein
MRSMDLPKMSTEKPTHTSRRSDNGECPNHLQQRFSQNAPNLVWVSDITYLKAGGKWYYLCVVIDLFSRKVISWRLSAQANADLVITTFQKAYDSRNAPYGLMFHSDRGTQYTSLAFRQLLDSLNIVQSFSKKGYPFDNAVCECFFKYLKREETSRRTYHTFHELQLSVFEYIEGYYNSRRPHSSLGYLTPNEAEFAYWEQA